MKTYKETYDLMNDFANGVVQLNRMSDSDLSNILVALEAIDKIANIIKIEQQPTSCEHTKLKSFEMIEKIIADYQLNN